MERSDSLMSNNKKTPGATRVVNGQQFEDKNDLGKLICEKAKTNSQLTVVEKHFDKTNQPVKTKYNTYYQVKYNNILLGYVTKKCDFYNLLDQVLGIPYEEIKSENTSRYEPDNVFVNVQANVIYILEDKHQNSKGSVTEKIGTFATKRKFYQQMLLDTPFSIQFIAVLQDKFFNAKESQDWIIDSRQCGVIFETKINFAQLGIPA